MIAPASRSMSRVWFAATLATVVGCAASFTEFWGVARPGSAASLFQDKVSMIAVLLEFVVILNFLALVPAPAVDLLAGRFRDAARGAAALAVIPLCFMFADRIPVLDPWWWYVGTNDAILSMAYASETPRHASWEVLEIRVTSSGFLSTPPGYAVLAYDATDAVGRAPAARPPSWRHADAVDRSRAAFPRATRVMGHVFVVYERPRSNMDDIAFQTPTTFPKTSWYLSPHPPPGPVPPTR